MDLEPLATHLKPQFGNIYDFATWTDELKAAVRHYLIEVAPEELNERFLSYIGHQVSSGSRMRQTGIILGHYSLRRIANFLHCAAVTITPTLDQLIDQIERAPSAGHRADAALWLTEHATNMQIIRMAKYSGRTELLEIRRGSGYRNPDAYDLVAVVPLQQLRVLWGIVKSEAHSPAADRHNSQITKPTRDVSPSEPSQARRWARIHGHRVADRSRVPTSIIQAFEAARRNSATAPVPVPWP